MVEHGFTLLNMVLSDMVEVAGMVFRLGCRLRVPMSSGDITVGGVLSCFARLETTSAFRCFGTEINGLSGTFVPLSFTKFVTIRRTKATLWYKYMKKICKAKFPIKTMIVKEREKA